MNRLRSTHFEWAALFSSPPSLVCLARPNSLSLYLLDRLTLRRCETNGGMVVEGEVTVWWAVRSFFVETTSTIFWLCA